MRVLLLADHCNPEWASLPVVGYKACVAIAEYAEATVATHVRNRENIEKHGLGRANVVYIDNEYLAKPLHKISRFMRGGASVSWTTGVAMSYPSYLAFEYEVWKRFRLDLEAGKFDLVHRITPMSPTKASPMATWSPRPFVLGPLNGGLKWPPGFTPELRREREWLTYVRDIYRFLPYLKATYRHSAAILAGFQHTIDDLPAGHLDRIINFPEVGIDPGLFGHPAEHRPKARVDFIFVGRFVPYKCPDVAVHAFARSETLQKHRLIMVGDGPERPRLEEIVNNHHLEKCVEFAGWKTQAEVGQLMRECDVFVFPSIRELGAGVVVEAMACGLPPVTVDYGAPGGLFPEDCGIKVPLGDKESLITRYVRELEALATDPSRRKTLGAAAHTYALRHYAWDAKARKTLEVYQWVLGEQPHKPDFWNTNK